MTATTAVNDKQEEAMKRLKTIETRHETLVSQFRNLAVSMAALRSRSLRTRKQLNATHQAMRERA